MSDDHAAAVQRDLGRLETKIAALETSLESLHSAIRELTILVSEAKGSWKTLVLLGGAASALGITVHKFFDFFPGASK